MTLLLRATSRSPRHLSWRHVRAVVVCGLQYRATRRHLSRCPFAPPRGMDAIGNSSNRRRDDTGFVRDGAL